MEINVKDIIIKRIDSKSANRFIKEWHYSGKVVPNSQLHFGSFYDKKLHGVMSFGASINKKGTINLVKGTGWNEFVELNRMAFDEFLPRNSESRCISVALRLIKKNCPQIKWIISFADGTQCGDGTIYRASGFKLVSISPNASLRINPITGKKVHIMQAYHLKISSKEFRTWKAIQGYQLKYVYFIDKSKIKDLTVPILPFSKIDDMNAGMYKGKKITLKKRHADLAQGSAVGSQSTGGVQNDQSAQMKKIL